MAKIVDINHLLSHKAPLRYSEYRAWLIWSLGGLFYAYQFILRIAPGVMTDDLMRDFSVEACALGLLSAFYYNAYTALLIPVGIGMDKFGPTKLLRISILLCIVGAIIFSISSSFYVACFGRLLIGAGSTCAFLGTLKLATLWFHPERLAIVVGLTMLLASIGAFLGQGPLALAINAFGWRETMLYLVIPIGILLAMGIWIFVRDEPPGGPLVSIPKAETNLKMILLRLKDIIIDYRIWALGLYGALMYVPLSAFADLWGVPFLMKVYGINRDVAGATTSMIFIGAGIGSPVVALFSDYFRARKIPMILGAALAVVINLAIILIPDIPLPIMYGLLFAAGFIFSAQPLIFASVCQLVPHSSSGSAISFTNMLVMSSGVVLQPLVGWLLDWVWDGVINNGIPLFTIADYRFALSTIPICLLIALCLMPFIPETFPKEENEG